MSNNLTGILAFEDGSVFRGKPFGARATIVGEAVFNTSMTGYQEIITDPSYFGQILTMTAPQIGNYGVNEQDIESCGPKISGLVIRELSPISSNWRSVMSLESYLEKAGISAIEWADTRSITTQLREVGALKACLSTEGLSDEEAIAKAKAWDGIVGIDLVKEVTCKEPVTLHQDGVSENPFTVEGTYLYKNDSIKKRYKVVAFDFGAKRSIFKNLQYNGFDVTIVPANTTAEIICGMQPDCLFLSNGPGDPSPLTGIHSTIAELLPNYPTFGICMGHQIITHALGAKTFKLKFGHRGGNHPVKNLETGKVSITSQNHGFASTPEAIENCGATVTEINLNDGTVEGLRHNEWPVFSVQYHPEAAPGPNDANHLFSDFYKMVAESKGDA